MPLLTTLKNGLRLLKLPKPNANIVTLGFIATTGSIVEDGYFPQGISYLAERLFWAGTDKYPSTRQLNLYLESIGGNFTSLTSQEMTQYYITVPAYHQHKGVSLLADIIQHSYFDNRDIETEKQFILQAITRGEQTEEEEISQLILENLYPQSNLGKVIRGTIDSILTIKREDIGEYLTHQYRPDTSYLVISGGLDETLQDLVEQEWNFWNPKTKKYVDPARFQTEPEIDTLPKIVYRQKGSAHTQLIFAFLLDHFQFNLSPNPEENEEKKTTELLTSESNPDLWYDSITQIARLLVLNTVLGQGISSRLWTKGVEEEMLFNKISSNIVRFKQAGYLQVYGSTDNNQFSFGLESILSVLESLRKTTVSINELSRSKEYLKGKLVLEHEDLLSSTVWQVEQVLGMSMSFELYDILDAIAKIQAAELRALACDIFIPERMTIAIMGTAKETKLVDRLVKKYLG